MTIRLFACLFLSLVLAACGGAAGRSGPVISTGDRYVVTTSNVEDYRLGAGDKIRVTVFNEPTLSGEFAVSTTGELSLPLVGNMAADGRRPEEIAAEFQRRLADGYLREPRVSVEVTAYRPFFILGEVKAPGQYPYASGLTALNAIATAQGFTPRSDRNTAYIRRSGANEEQPYRLTPDLRVLPGDTIRIGERFF